MGGGGEEGGLSNIDFSKLGGMGGAGGMPDLSALAGGMPGGMGGAGDDEGEDDDVSDSILFRRSPIFALWYGRIANGMNRRTSPSWRRPTKSRPRSRRFLKYPNM